MLLKTYRNLLFLVIPCLLFSCEDTPDISIDTEPLPIIFGVFDKFEYVHYLKVGKTFQAETNPMNSAGTFDSLYFKDVDITITFRDLWQREESIKPYVVTEVPKDDGVFHSPNQLIYRFEKELRDFYGYIHVSVKLPGQPEAYGEVRLVDSVKVNTPKNAQQYIYLTPDSPLRIQWMGHYWNEIDISFGFLEETIDSLRPRTIHIQNTNSFASPNNYREMSITYEEFVRELLSQLPEDPSVLKRYFAYHSIKINGGDENMVNYIKYLDGYTDFNDREFSNIKNGLGLIASRMSGMVDSLRFDYDTRKLLLAENRLKKYKFISF